MLILSSPSQWWRQTIRYTALDPQSEDLASRGPHPSNTSIQQILTSRRVRLTATALLIIFIVAAITHSPVPVPVPAPVPAPKLGLEHAPEHELQHALEHDEPVVEKDTTDWSKYAYVQYVTNKLYLCNSVMLFESLHRLDSKAQRLMMYPDTFDLENNPTSGEAKLLLKARDEYNVKLRPITVQYRSGGDGTWAESYTKLLAFNQTDYTRVLGLDSDSTVLQHMDELFFIPSAALAMPRAYWLKPDENRAYLSSQLILVEPSHFEFKRVEAAIHRAGKEEYDMEILNNLYGESAIVLPHRRYDLLTSEFKRTDHSQYLGNDIEVWDAQKVLDEAKYLHFSDWPLSKPWLATPQQVDEAKPPCDKDASGVTTSCATQTVWVNVHVDFRKRRKEICGDYSN